MVLPKIQAKKYLVDLSMRWPSSQAIGQLELEENRNTSHKGHSLLEHSVGTLSEFLTTSQSLYTFENYDI